MRDFCSGAYTAYAKSRNLMKLCCYIVACAIKNGVEGVAADFVLAIVADVDAHLAMRAGEPVDLQALSQFDRIRRQVAPLNTRSVGE